jgi:signal transduction histidine kinase
LRTSVEALLRSPGMEAEDQAAVADILEQTKRLATITQSLLLLSRADAGKLRLDLQSGDLREVAELCVEDAGILAEERGISISADLPPSAPARLDRTHAAQIVMNLLDNAVKYNHEGGQVRLTLRAEAGHWHLMVANTGPGIPPAVASRVFDRFFRAEHTAAVDGHGLGLSLSRELARAHGGDLALAPKEDGWTAFVLTLPSRASWPDR